MSPARNNTLFRALCGLVLLLAAVAAPQAVRAECQPGQMQEANLAYQSAAEFLASQQWDQAIARMQSIIAVCPEHVEATRGIGIALMSKGDEASLTAAVPYFQKVIELRGDEVEANDFDFLGKTYARLKKYKEARAEFMKAERLAPDDCGVLFNLAVMHYASGYNPQSVETLEHALEVCPDNRDRILGQLSKSAEKAAAQQKANGNMEKAAYYEGLTAKYGAQAGGSTTYDMVKQKMSAKDYQGAIALLEPLVQKEPDNSSALLTLARAQDAVANKRASVATYEKYLALKPTDAQATGSMIQVMVEAGMCSEASARAAKAAGDLASQGRANLAAVNYSWGLAYECLGDFETAKGKFQSCVGAGNPRYEGSARTQVQRMTDLQSIEDAKAKKAAQNR
ncbi:tetratricopeptide repeat protein [bacterium]|nr:tetratricopeptide repeat protein [bacterium]